MKVTAKRQKNGEETLWLKRTKDEYLDDWSVFTHRPGDDVLSLTVVDGDRLPHCHTFFSREDVQKLLPFLQRFADGGDLGIVGESEL